MRKLLMRDLMTKDVRTVRKTTPFKDVARILAANGVTAVPVVDGDDNEVVGIVSEADLLPKQVRPEGPSWRVLFSPRRAKAAGRVAADVMSSPAVTADADLPIVAGARLMFERGIKRLPVVDRYGKLTGIVSRADLIRLFVRTDEEVRDEVVHEVFERALCQPIAAGQAGVAVTDGVVTLGGRLERKSMLPVAVALTRQVAGVVDVVDNQSYEFDDTHLPPGPPADPGFVPGLRQR